MKNSIQMDEKQSANGFQVGTVAVTPVYISLGPRAPLVAVVGQNSWIVLLGILRTIVVINCFARSKNCFLQTCHAVGARPSLQGY